MKLEVIRLITDKRKLKIIINQTNLEWTFTPKIIKHKTNLEHPQILNQFIKYILTNLLKEL